MFQVSLGHTIGLGWKLTLYQSFQHGLTYLYRQPRCKQQDRLLRFLISWCWKNCHLWLVFVPEGRNTSLI